MQIVYSLTASVYLHTLHTLESGPLRTAFQSLSQSLSCVDTQLNSSADSPPSGVLFGDTADLHVLSGCFQSCLKAE